MCEIGFRYQIQSADALRDFEGAMSVSKETAQPCAEMLALTCGMYTYRWSVADEGRRLLQVSLALARRLGSQLFIG